MTGHGLDEVDQAIYRAFYRERLRYKEIAQALNKNEDFVRHRGARLILKIKDEVEERIEGSEQLHCKRCSKPSLRDPMSSNTPSVPPRDYVEGGG